MGLVFKVGEHSDFPPVPKNFPTCGDWLPPIEEKEIIVVQLQNKEDHSLNTAQSDSLNMIKDNSSLFTTSNSGSSRQHSVRLIENVFTLSFVFVASVKFPF